MSSMAGVWIFSEIAHSSVVIVFDRKISYVVGYKIKKHYKNGNMSCSHLFVLCFIPYYMTNSYRPGIKKFDWFKASL